MKVKAFNICLIVGLLLRMAFFQRYQFFRVHLFDSVPLSFFRF